MGEPKIYELPVETKDVVYDEPEFGDGDDGGEGEGIVSVNIDFVYNGVIVTFILDNGEEHKEVYLSLDEALNRIRESVGRLDEE